MADVRYDLMEISSMVLIRALKKVVVMITRLQYWASVVVFFMFGSLISKVTPMCF